MQNNTANQNGHIQTFRVTGRIDVPLGTELVRDRRVDGARAVAGAAPAVLRVRAAGPVYTQND